MRRKVILSLLSAVVAVGVMAATLLAVVGPWVQTDDWNYVPGETAIITGGGFAAGQPVRLQVVHIQSDGTGEFSEISAFHDPWFADVNESGGFETTWPVPEDAAGKYMLLRATQESSGLLAEYRFVDAGNPSADLDQCANDPLPSPVTDGCNVAASEWVNGNLGASKSAYREGDSIPYRMKFDNLSLTSHTVIIKWDTTKSSTHAIDYLTTFNRTVGNANPCLGVSGCNSAVFNTFAVPADPQVTGGGVTPIAGNFRLYGGTITGVSAYTYPDGAGFTGDKSASIAITFTASVVNPVLAWGGHIATRQDWGATNSAVSISGSPYHMSLVDLDGRGGSQDRSLSAEAVIFPASIRIIKDAVPDDAQDFSFTTTGGLSPATFSLDDDANGTLPNFQLYSGILITANTGNNYTVVEGAVSAWTLSFGSPVCTVTTPNGGTQTGNVGTRTLSINLREGEDVTCTFINTLQQGTLKVFKHVVNDNGGTAVAGDWSIHVTSGGSDVTGSPQPGSEPVGSMYTLNGGTYNVSETGGPSGYSFTGYSGDCDSSGNVTVVAGQEKTCTLTNDDQAAKLIIIKSVTNDSGGAAVAGDFSGTIGGTATFAGGNTWTGTVTPGQTKDMTAAGTYDVTETAAVGYTTTYSAGCSGSIALGETKTCTVTNDDQAAKLIIIKTVTNDSGGTAVAGDFSGTITGTATFAGGNTWTGTVTPGQTKNMTAAGTYNVTETAAPGYTTTYSADCSGSIALGETKTCTVTNDDQAAKLIIIKTVINNSGGTAVAGDFSGTISGTATFSGGNTWTGTVTPGQTKDMTAAGTYNVTETAAAGYTTSYSADCSGSIALGQVKTCTVTNDDQAAKLIIIKTVINDNGGTAAAGAFSGTITGTATFAGGNTWTGTVTPGQTKDMTAAGTYNVTETAAAGYTTTYSAYCSGSIALGQTKTCTVTNNDIAPKLHLRKTLINDDGGTATVANFTLTANGTGSNDLSGTTPVDSGAGLLADTWALSETNVYGYSASAWVCVGGTQNGSNITVGIGGEATCTITNNDVGGTIVIIKNAKPATGSFAFTTTGAGYNSFTLTGSTANNGNRNSQGGLDAGTYTVQESMQLGWLLTGIGGDPNIPLACTVNTGGTSTGTGNLNTRTATIDLKNGDTVTCVFENTGNGATRTQGFWATHPQLAQIAWFGGSAFNHTFPGVADRLICGRAIEGPGPNSPGDISKLMGGFWSDISKTSTGAKRSPLDQARMQLLQQLLAAELNGSAFGSAPVNGSFAAWETALCGTDVKAINTAQQQAGSFNSAGDSANFTPGTSADSKGARAIANYAFWNIIKP
jgi:hypothetical protein